MQHFIAAVPGSWHEGVHAALMAVQEPGFLDRVGAGAIALFVLGCWLLAPAPGRR